jgi:hypothetical protein
MVYRGGAGHGTNIKEDADVMLEYGPECVEEPAMGVYLLLVFWTGTTSFSAVSNLREDLGGVLVDVSRHVFLANLGLGDAFLRAVYGSDDAERSRVDL